MRILLLCLLLVGCSAIRPESTVYIYPVAKDGITKVEIKQTRLGKTEYKKGDIEVSYDSKGKSLIEGVTKEVLPILTLEAIKD